MNRTLMNRVRGRPGATATIEARRKKKVRPPEQAVRMMLRKIGALQRYC